MIDFKDYVSIHTTTQVKLLNAFDLPRGIIFITVPVTPVVQISGKAFVKGGHLKLAGRSRKLSQLGDNLCDNFKTSSASANLLKGLPSSAGA